MLANSASHAQLGAEGFVSWCRKACCATAHAACAKMKAKPSEPLWALLRGRQINGAKFRRQHPIPPYIADFACIEANLVVEVDGRSHDIAEQAAYDAARTLALANAGWRVLRVRDNDVLTASHTVAAKIAEALNS